MKKNIFLLILIIVAFSAQFLLAQQNSDKKPAKIPNKKIAITFDNLPADREYDKAERRFINEQILEALKVHDTKATGFVIGENIDSDWELLVDWLENGHTLGVLTNSGQDIENVPLDFFITDIKKGIDIIEDILQTYKQKNRYFRYPYLHYGLDPDTRNFREIQAEAEEYFRNRDKGRGTGYKQWKRWEYLMKDRLKEDGTITNFDAHNYRVSERYFSRLDDDQRTFGGFWFPLAPTDGYLLGNSGYNPGIGRVNVIAFHPTNQSIIYAGTPSGGLWRTNNEGTSWFPLTESIPRIGVSGIAIHPDNPNIIYILTGDGDGGDTRCIGVLKTFDGGQTWYRTGLQFNANDLVRGYKLAMKPGDPTTLFAVTTNGLYRTENSGGDWTVVRSGSYRDLEFKPGDAETIYLSSSNSFYRSTSGGDAGTFNFISSGLPSGESRVALAVSAANPTWVYYLAGGGGPTGSFKGLYRSTNSGTSFSTIITSPNILDSSLSGNDDCSDGCDQAGYDLAIAVDPNDGDEVITGGINVWRCEDIDVSNTWNIIAHWNTNTVNNNGLEYTHADIHELVYQDNNRLWCGSDGGVWLSTDDGQTWTDTKIQRF